MRRRFIDVGKLKRLPSRKSRVAEPVQPSSYFHWKLLMGGVILILLDSLMNFRLEYLYPVLMFMRSVYDSYKYQGFIFSLLFISLVVYLDLLCWTVLTVPWLFLGASTCVWLEIVRTIDHGFTYSVLILGLLFLYVEISHRITTLPLNMVNISRPFAAHCIGYPVVTMSFLIKHQITHIIRQRQQRRVSEENSVFFDILQKALPPPPVEEVEEPLMEDGSLAEGSSLSNHVISNGIDSGSGKKASPKVSSSNLGSSGGGSSTGSGSTTRSSHKTSGGSNSSSSGPGGSNSRHKISNGLKSLMQDPKILKALSLDMTTTPSSTLVSTSNGEVVPSMIGGAGGRPLSAGNKVHLPTGKKQAMVKAVPRTEQSSSTTSDLEQKMQKTKQAMEMMNMDLKDERQAKMELQTTVSQLELEVKKLRADLHASCLQEEETASRVDHLQSLEKTHKHELQRLKNENENLQNKLSKTVSTKQQDQATITDLEKRLKSESDTRTRVELELRDYQHATRNSYSAKEVKQLNDKLRKTEKDLESIQKELMKKEKVCDELRKEVNGQRMAIQVCEGEKQQLKVALNDETRVKIELFTALSDAGRKQQTLIDECHRKNMEIGRLRQNLAEIMAIIPAHPSTPQPVTTSAVGGMPGPYPPASSPQN